MYSMRQLPISVLGGAQVPFGCNISNNKTWKILLWVIFKENCMKHFHMIQGRRGPPGDREISRWAPTISCLVGPIWPRVLARVPWEHPSVDFCTLVNKSLHDTDLEIDAVLPKKRARKKKRMSDERCPDEVVLDEVKNYRINSFNFIMDSVGQNLKRRFLDHEQSYKDFACFDPRLQRVETVRDSFIGN